MNDSSRKRSVQDAAVPILYVAVDKLSGTLLGSGGLDLTDMTVGASNKRSICVVMVHVAQNPGVTWVLRRNRG